MEKTSENTLSIAGLCEGAAIEMVDGALADLWANIADVNTEAKAKRKVTLSITLKPDEDRAFATMSLDVRTHLAKSKPALTRLSFGRERGGKIVASELSNRQMKMSFANEEHVDLKTGEVRAEIIAIGQGGGK